jgi:hypothetical protein
MANPNCPIPNNINPLQPTGFQLAITKLPEVTFFCQTAIIPEVLIPPVDMGTPLSINKLPGDRITFSEFTINFLIDENMNNYISIWNWIIGLGFPENYTQYQELLTSSQVSTQPDTADNPAIPQFGMLQGNYSDATLQILGSNNVAVRTIHFVDLHPISLSSLEFKANTPDVQYLTGSATFGYTYFNLL